MSDPKRVPAKKAKSVTPNSAKTAAKTTAKRTSRPTAKTVPPKKHLVAPAMPAPEETSSPIETEYLEQLLQTDLRAVFEAMARKEHEERKAEPATPSEKRRAGK